jgi:hypothetical protein
MKRATRWTRFTHRAIAVSAVAAIVVAAVPLLHGHEDGTSLRLATADLRSRAAEAALVAHAWDTRRATGAFTRAQAEQLAHRIDDARGEVARAPVDLSPTAAPVAAIADALLLAVRDLEALPAPDDSNVRGDRLAGLADDLRVIERALGRGG